MRHGGAIVLVLGVAACGGAVDERVVSPVAVAPLVAARVALPAGARAVSVYAAPEGGGLVGLDDGRVLAVDSHGEGAPVVRAPGDTSAERPVVTFASRGGGVVLALDGQGARLIDGPMSRHADLPSFLSHAATFARHDDGGVWGMPDGVLLDDGRRWLSIETGDGPVRGVSEVVAFDTGDTWVRAGTWLGRARYGGGAGAVVWGDAAPGAGVGAVTAIARIDRDRGVIASALGVTFASSTEVRVFRGGEGDGAPGALGGGGGWAWVGWAGQLLRSDGSRWESLASGVTAARISVDDETGASAFVVDLDGGVLHLEAEPSLRTRGLLRGDQVRDTRIFLEALPPNLGGGRAAPSKVDFSVDGHSVASRTEAPWGWGRDGGRALEVGTLTFGAHRVDVVATYAKGEAPLSRRIDFAYTSPLGRVPGFADVVGIVASHCSRCHATGVAHPLTSYASLSAEASGVRAAVRTRRMPPDIALDAATIAVLTAWVDGGAVN